MRYLVFVTDYDGTIATGGKPESAALSAIERLRTSGRGAILLTGRRVDDLLSVCPRLRLFDCVVAENGAVLYQPRTREQTLLGKPPPAEFVQRLRKLTDDSIGVGKVVVATSLPHHSAVLQAIQEMGLELQIVFNKDAVMVLPAGVNKASGMDYALRKLGFSRHEAVGIGDAENDYSFLERCECAVAVANALPSIRELAAFTTKSEAGQGVAELIEELIANDLSRMHGRLERIHYPLMYAEGNMRDRSFYFRGPARRHNLKAQNLVIFSQIAEGIDEETWLFHLYRGTTHGGFAKR